MDWLQSLFTQPKTQAAQMSTPVRTPAPNSGTGVWTGNTQIGSSQKPGGVQYAPTGNTAPRSTGGTSSGGGAGSDSLMNVISSSADDQRKAAEAAAEANRQKAYGAYQVVQKAGEQAKEQAKGTYDWIVNTIGSNREDLLNKTTTNYEEQKANYALQEKKTKDSYDEARFEIRSTYQELAREQEKILRGTNMAGNSSRSMEAQLRLNRLLGKDISKVSGNEADAIALIGNAVSTLGKKFQDTKDSIEKEATNKLQEVQLQYKQQIDSIDLNMFKNEKDREDAYKAAEAQLTSDIAKINSWAGQAKVQVSMQLATMQTNLDNFIVDMTDVNGGLSRDLTANTEAANNTIKNITSGFKFDMPDIASVPKQAVQKNTVQSQDNLFNTAMTPLTAFNGGQLGTQDTLLGALSA